MVPICYNLLMNYLKIILNDSEKKRLFSKISIDPITNCWNWTAAKTLGYGAFRYRRKTYRVHRLVYAWLVKPIPTAKYGKGVPIFDHICRNHSCCNPQHLELVPQRINLLRGTGISAINSKKTHCIRGHLLPQAKEKLPNGRFMRRCVICRRINRMRRYYTNK